MDNIRHDLERLARIDRILAEKDICYTADDVVAEFERFVTECSLSRFMTCLADRLASEGRIRTAETYRLTLRSFMKFRKKKDVLLDRITARMMESYQAWLFEQGVVKNTVSFYLRILRAVYNRAVCHNLIEDRTPFRDVYTGVDKTVKRALSLNVIREIKSLNLSAFPLLDYSRDMFMISFYLRGMSFVDMAYLRKTDLKGGRVSYRRRKTGRLMEIEWTEEMQCIVDKYPFNKSDYLLPIIKKKNIDERREYQRMGRIINVNLKKVAEIMGGDISLTMYVARHSWASVARSNGIPLNVISEGMGHDSETTTRIYLASLDATVVDDANALILSRLR